MTKMTKKDYNALRHAMFEAAMQSEPIKDALSSMFDTQVWVFDLSDGQRHEIVLSRHEKGFTTNELRDAGWGEAVQVKRLMLIDKQTQCCTPEGWSR